MLPNTETSQDFISIVIVNFNGIKWLQKCLDSIINQNYSYYEIILVDNCSTDGSVKFIHNNFPNIKIINSEKNGGFAYGNNLGIKNAKGDLILMLNNDSWLSQSFLHDIILKWHQSNKDVIAPTQRNYQENDIEINTIRLIDFCGHPVCININTKYSKNFYLQGICLLFNKNFYIQTGGLDEDFFMYFEETDWFWRLNMYKKSFEYIPDIFVNHFGSGTTLSTKRIKYLLFLWRNQNCLQMLLKNYEMKNLLWVLPLYFIQNTFEIFIFLIILKPKIAFSYIEGWYYNIKMLKKTLNKRLIIQQNRVVSDKELFKLMYKGSGKFLHFMQIIKQSNNL